MRHGASSWLEADLDGVRWRVEPHCRDLLLGPNGLRLAEWLRTGQAQVVKTGIHRGVYRVALAGGIFYIKHNRVPDLKTWLRQMIRPSKARIELDRIHAVAGHGIPTVEPLAIGERQAFLGAGESYLITRSLDQTVQLNALMARHMPAMPTARQTRLRQRLSSALARLVARMHDAGIRHDDLHAANILVRLAPDDEPALYVIDLDAVRLGSPLDWPASRDNLVILNRWFLPRSRRADRLRFWRAYYEARGFGRWHKGPAGPRQHFVRAGELEQRTDTASYDFWEDRDARCFRNNRWFRKARATGVAGHAVTDLDAQELAKLLADPDAPFHEPPRPLLKNSRSSTVAELEMQVAGVRRRVIYKRFRVTAWSDPWVGLLRRSPALRSWFFGQAFRERCLPTARPLAVFHRRRRGLILEGYLLTEKIEDAQELRDFSVRLGALPPDARRSLLRRRLDEIARLVRELHRRGYSHRDLKAANILVSQSDEPLSTPLQPVSESLSPVPNFLPWPSTSVWLIDLVGVRGFRHLPWIRRIQNLARLNASFVNHPALTRTDRLRFLRVYLQWSLRGREGWKGWWRAVAEATGEKVRRNVRTGRPLG